MNKNLIIDRVDGVKSVTVGITFIHGSRNETSLTRGFSHLLEHMLFKGTKTRDALTISRSIERLGGFINGFTTHDYVLIYAKVPYYAVNEAIDILMDMTTNSTFDGFEMEKNVILEEIASIEDEPEELIYEEYMKNVWVNSSLEYPIAGTPDSIENATKSDLYTFLETVKSRGIIMAVSGNCSELIVTPKMEKFIERPLSSPISGEQCISSEIDCSMEFHSKLDHGFVGFPINKIETSDLYNLSAINSILLDGMSSRLFQLIREKHGLVYDIYPVIDVFSDIANFGIYFSSKSDNSERVIDLIREEISHCIADELSRDEVDFAKSYMKGNLLLGLENTNSRMFMHIKDCMYNRNRIGIDGKLKLIDAITVHNVNEFITGNFNRKNINIMRLKSS